MVSSVSRTSIVGELSPLLRSLSNLASNLMVGLAVPDFLYFVICLDINFYIVFKNAEITFKGAGGGLDMIDHQNRFYGVF